MAKTLVDVNEQLLVDAMAATGQRTKRGTVLQALEQVVRQARALEYLRQLQGGVAADLDDPDVIARAGR